MPHKITVHAKKETLTIQDPSGSYWTKFLTENKFPLLLELNADSISILEQLTLYKIENFVPDERNRMYSSHNRPAFYFKSKNPEEKSTFSFIETFFDNGDVRFYFNADIVAGWPKEKRPYQQSLISAFGAADGKINPIVMTQFVRFLYDLGGWDFDMGGEEETTYMKVNHS